MRPPHRPLIEEQNDTVTSRRRQSVEAVRVRACSSCQAPGVYKAENDPNVDHYRPWPAIVLKVDDKRVGTAVGGVCPCCGKERSADDDLGEIWHKEL